MRLRNAFLLAVGLGWLPHTAPAREDSPAEAAYRRLADRVHAARTLKVTSTGIFKADGVEATFEASLQMKAGNRMVLDQKTRGMRHGTPFEYVLRIVSDGKSVRRRTNRADWETFSTPPTWNDNVALNLCRGGFPSGLEMIQVREKPDSPDIAVAFRTLAEPTGFKLWDREKIGGRETMPIEFHGRNDSEFLKETDTVLWIDPDSGLPRRRSIVVHGEHPLNVTETYEAFAVDSDVADDVFTVNRN